MHTNQNHAWEAVIWKNIYDRGNSGILCRLAVWKGISWLELKKSNKCPIWKQFWRTFTFLVLTLFTELVWKIHNSVEFHVICCTKSYAEPKNFFTAVKLYILFQVYHKMYDLCKKNNNHFFPYNFDNPVLLF